MDFYKDSKKRVLIFSLAYIPFVSGAELAVKEITDRINDLEFDMVTLRFDKKLPKFERVGNVNVYRINSSKLIFPFLAFLKGVKLNRKRKYSVVWSIMANRAGFAALFFKFWNPKVKYLLTLQEGDTLDYPEKRMGILKIILTPFFRKIFTKADHVQAISNYLADWARRMGAKAPIEVVPNGVDLSKIKNKIPASSADRSKIKNKEGKIIITTSRLVHKNGIDVLIRAVAELYVQHRMSNIKLQILGAGPEEKKLKDLAEELRVDDIVQFFGHIEPEKVYDYLAQADIFVRPSRSEGLGSSFLEAMGAGLPVVGAAVGGIPDFIKDGETGLFCKVDDQQDLAKKIKLLMTDEELAKRIAGNGRQLVLEKYDWDNIAKQMQNTLSHIIAIAKMCDSKKANMKILICTGLYPPDIGGPAEYAKNLKDEFLRMNNKVKVLVYKRERKMPTGISHFFYLLRTLPYIVKTDLVVALDTFSVGLPSVLVAKIFRKKIILRIGGDYLWESYINRSGNLLTLKQFYLKKPKLSLKEKLIQIFSKFVLRNASVLIFNTVWQSVIFEKEYNIKKEKIFIVENFYGKKIISKCTVNKNYIFAGRLIKLKNIAVLKDAFEEARKENEQIKLEIISNISHDELSEKIKCCYAVVLPSVSEINPNLIADAVMFGKPFILTKENGLNENIKKLGVFINPFDKVDIKNKILHLADSENYEKHKKNIIDSNFTHSWNEIAKEFLEIYRKI